MYFATTLEKVTFKLATKLVGTEVTKFVGKLNTQGNFNDYKQYEQLDKQRQFADSCFIRWVLFFGSFLLSFLHAVRQIFPESILLLLLLLLLTLFC